MTTVKPHKIAIITGDASLPDPTKQGQRYGDEDLLAQRNMEHAFSSMDDLSCRVFDRHQTLFADLHEYRPDLVVNFCDTGYYNRPDQEIHIATELELMGLPYTGAPPRAMLLCFDKQIVRLVAQTLGLEVPTERFVPAAQVADADIDTFPALIKPNAADGSVGITQHSVVNDSQQARTYLRWLATELPGKDVLVQEYLPGPEYGLGLIGNPGDELQALPMLEVDFSALPQGLAPILSFESKTQPDSPYWTDIRFKPANLDPALQMHLGEQCRGLFERLSLRDYGRFDFRADRKGRIKLMEVNPNPAWGDDAKLAIMAELGGLSYAQLLERLVSVAWTRITATA